MEKPNITLNLLEKIAVEVSTQEKCDILMRVYELGKWVLMNDGILPTEFKVWNKYGELTCVGAGTNIFSNSKGRFGYGPGEFYIENDWTIISDEIFYEKQGISPEKLIEINAYFDWLENNP